MLFPEAGFQCAMKNFQPYEGRMGEEGQPSHSRRETLGLDRTKASLY